MELARLLREVEAVDDARGARVRRPKLPQPPDVFYEFQDAAELVLLVLDEARTACAFSRVWRNDEHRNAKAKTIPLILKRWRLIVVEAAPSIPHDDNRSLRSGDHTC